MPKITYTPTREDRKAGRVFTLSGGARIKLKPGVTEVSAVTLKALREFASFKELERVRAVDIEADKDPLTQESSEFTLDVLTTLLPSIEDLEVLERWFANEKRQGGIVAIAARIEELTGEKPGQSSAGDES